MHLHYFKVHLYSSVTTLIYTVKETIQLLPAFLFCSRFSTTPDRRLFITSATNQQSATYRALLQNLRVNGLGWNQNDLLALAHSAPKALPDPAIKTQRSRKKMQSPLHKKMMERTICPFESFFCKRSTEHRDDQGQSGEACYMSWALIHVTFCISSVFSG